MQNSVRELIFEIIFVEQFLNPVTNDGVLQDLVDVGPLVRVGVQQGLEDVLDVLAEVRGNLRILSHNNFSCKLMK